MSKKTKIDKYALAKNQETIPLVKRVVSDYLLLHWKTLLLAVFCMIVSSSMTAAFAAVLEPIIDQVLVKGNTSLVWYLGLGIFAIFFTRGVVTYFEVFLLNKVVQSVAADIQKNLFGHFMDLDLKFFHQNPSGQLISRVTNDVEVIRGALSGTIIGFGKSAITLALLIGVLFYQDWVLTIATFTIFPFIAIFVAMIGRKLRRMSGNIQSQKARLTDKLSQIFHGVRLVKAYGMEGYEKETAGKAITDLRSLILKSVSVSNLSTPVNETLVGIVVLGIIVYGGHQVAAGASTAGQLLSFITAFTMAYEPMKKLARLNNTLQMGLGATDRVFDMLDTPIEVTDKDQAKDVQLNKPEIKFEDVHFKYDQTDDNSKKALNGINITIPAGRVTALVGRSGSGKTTIMNLIPRFFDTTSGHITIDDISIRDIRKNSLRQNIALVSQDITIFDDTVWSNIGYGRTQASRDDIVKAAIAAEAHEFIEALPQGYDTTLGEDGVTLSGGQRQRISIARAIVRDAPILLLDEATSALDSEAERAIQKTLSKIQKGRTTLVIAHRLSTIQNADQIIVLENGRVAEQGTHSVLMEDDTLYRQMVELSLSSD